MSWQLASFVILGTVLALGFAWYERSRPPARVLALVAALAALAVVGRIAFAPLPNVKPTTDIVLFSGYALGGAPGFAVGAVTALVSNIFFTHGPWTPWQMAAWGGVGIAGGALGALVRLRSTRRGADGAAHEAEPRELGRWPLALACGIAGLAFGLIMDLHLWTLGAEQTAAAYAVISARSLPFNLAHAVGNVVFCLLVGPPLVRALRRYRRRFEVRWPAPMTARNAARIGGAGTALVAASLSAAVLMGSPAAAEAASSTDRAACYLVRAQNEDGGLGDSPRAASNPFHTAWAALGLAAAGQNPRHVSREGNSAIEYIQRNAGSLTSTTELARTILVARSAGMSPRRFAGRNLVAELREHRASDGSFDNGVAFTAFGVLALRAAGDDPGSLSESAEWLEGRQNPDPEDRGFSLSSGRPSDADITGSVLEALAAAGRGDRPPADDAADYLMNHAQASSGGFGQEKGDEPNAQSTAWAVRGLVAVGHGNGKDVDHALRFLRGLQDRKDGGFRFSRSRAQTPVWVTADVLPALQRQSFPLEPARGRPAGDCRPSDPEKRPAPSSPVDKTGRGDRAGRERSEDRPQRRRRSRPEGGGRRGDGGSGPGFGAGAGAGPGAGGGAGPGVAGTSFGAAPAGPAGVVTAPVPPAGLPPAPPSSPPPDRRSPVAPPKFKATDSAWRSFSDTGAVRPRPAAARRPGGDRDERSPAGTALTAVGILAVALMALTAATARGRRLWAVARRRTT